MPTHIVNWNFATPEWKCPSAVNDIQPGGQLKWRMEAKDGSMGFDLEGTYKTVEPQSLLAHTLTDGREVIVRFEASEAGIKVSEEFQPDSAQPEALQQQGWQAILNSFKRYCEEA